MSRNKESQHLFFIGQPLAFLPIGHLRQIVRVASALRAFVEQTKQPCLALCRVLLRLLRPLHRLVDSLEQRCPRSQRIQRSGLDQRLNHTRVHHPQIHLFAELPEALESPTHFRPRLDDRIDRVPAHVLYRRQPKPDGLARRRKLRPRHLHVRRLHADAQLLALADILHHVLRLRRFTGQQRGHELHRIMRLQISRLVRHQRIRRRVRLVKPVPRKLLHLVEDFAHRLFGMPKRRRPGQEAVLLFVHPFLALLPHRPPQQVRLAKRVARQTLRNLHHLFLVDNHPIRILENPFQLRQ